MQNIAEFRIIGRVVRINTGEKVTRLDLASNYNRKDDAGEWQTDTHYNSVSAFGTLKERIDNYDVGDLVHVTGRVRQNSYEREGQTIYSVDLVADAAAILAKKNTGGSDD